MILTINSKFRPFSYDELVKPLVQYKQAYDEVEKDYSNLAAQTEAWKDIATQENSPEAYAMYKKYSDELNAITDDFSKGMTLANRSQLMSMKKRYASEITPIAKADAALKEANKYRDTVRGKDPNAIFYVDRYSKLDDFLHGRTANNDYISGTQVTNRTAARAQAIGANLYNQYIAQGMSPNEAIAAIQSDPSLQTLYNEEWSAANGDSLDEKGKARLQNAIKSGVDNATAKIAEGEYMTAAQRDASARGWQSLKLSERQQEMASERLELEKEQQQWAREQKEEQTKGVLLPNGNRLKPIGGGRMLEYNEKSKEWKIVSASTTASGVSGRTAEKQALFTTLEYTGDSFGTPGSTDKFSIKDSEKITFSDLSPKARKKLQEDLKEYGLSIEDIDIYKDQDYLSRNHYRIVRKGYGAEGITLQQEGEGL